MDDTLCRSAMKACMISNDHSRTHRHILISSLAKAVLILLAATPSNLCRKLGCPCRQAEQVDGCHIWCFKYLWMRSSEASVLLTRYAPEGGLLHVVVVVDESWNHPRRNRARGEDKSCDLGIHLGHWIFKVIRTRNNLMLDIGWEFAPRILATDPLELPSIAVKVFFDIVNLKAFLTEAIWKPKTILVLRRVSAIKDIQHREGWKAW